MPIIRTHKTDNYSIISNHVARNDALSLQAKGLFFYLMTLPDDWVIRLPEVERHATNGRDATRKALKELEDAKYVHRCPLRDEGGKVCGWDFDVYEVPTDSLKTRETVVTDSLENRLTEKPSDGKSDTTNNLLDKETDNTNDVADAPAPSPDGSGATQSKQSGCSADGGKVAARGTKPASDKKPTERGYNPKTAHTFKPDKTDAEIALSISKWQLKHTQEAVGRTLVAKPTGIPIIKLFKAGVHPDTIVATIRWLNGPNLKNEFKFDVWSTDTLATKWDRIQSAIDRLPKQPTQSGLLTQADIDRQLERTA